MPNKMPAEGPMLETLLRRVAETPPDFLREPRIGSAGEIHVMAVVHDLLDLLGAIRHVAGPIPISICIIITITIQAIFISFLVILQGTCMAIVIVIDTALVGVGAANTRHPCDSVVIVSQ